MKATLTLFLLAFAASTSLGQHNTYYVGHSGFGWDLIVGAMVDDLADDAGITTYNYGYQFIGGSCLSNQWVSHATPQGGTDSHVELATGNYDQLVVTDLIPIDEAYWGQSWGNCHLGSIAATDSFFDLATGANPGTRMMLMEYHNEIDSFDLDPIGEWNNLNFGLRWYWEMTADTVGVMNNADPLCIVPIAAAFSRFVDSVEAGNVPGYTHWREVFDPNDPPEAIIHPTEETYYLVACVHYAVFFGQSPEGLTNQTFAAAGWGFDPPTPAQALIMQRIAWEVVNADPYACLPAVTSDGNTMVEEAQVKLIQNGQYVELQFEEGVFEQMEIYSTSGQLVYSQSVTGSRHIPNINSLSNGAYLCRLSGTGHQYTNKLIVSR